MELSQSEKAQVFSLLDDYARKRHGCFVTECFLNRETDGYLICFRPVGLDRNDPNVHACRYVKVPLEEMHSISVLNKLTPEIMVELDRDLKSLILEIRQ